MLWDTAGQEEFDAITKAYYRGMSHIGQFFTLFDLIIPDAKPLQLPFYERFFYAN